MSSKLYVGNIPYRLTENELAQTFAPFGDVVEAKIISDQYTGRSRGFGFVEMANHEQSSKAIDQLNGTELQGRTIVVAPARQRNRS